MNSIRINRLKFALLLLFTAVSSSVLSQEVTQTVRGTVVDELNGAPVAGLTVQLHSSNSLMETTSDDEGNFEFSVPVGRYKLNSNSTLYKIAEQEVVVISGHAARIKIIASPLIHQLKDVEVTSSTGSDLPGTIRSLSIEKTLRFPANFFDPVRVATAYPGVVAASDQGNAIIVRGNSPNGLLWRLNGLDIVNPNHLANAGTVSDVPVANGGGVNMLSAQMLDRTDFYVGAIPASYGNALAGVVDMKLREGSNSEMQYTAQASLIGLDFAAEGPVGKNNSFVANYRYSTVGVLSAMGLALGDEAISFQDFSFHWNTNFKTGGSFSLFGIWGASKNIFEAKDDWEEDKDMYNIDYTSATNAAGFNFTKTIGKGELFLGTLYSGSNHLRHQLPSDNAPPANYVFMTRYQAEQNLVSSSIRYRRKFGPSTAWTIGFMSNYMENMFDLRGQNPFFYQYSVEGARATFLLQPYTQLTAHIKPSITIDAGARFIRYTSNNSNSLEPRINIRITPFARTRIDASYSLISQVPSVFIYSRNHFELTKSHNIELAIQQKFSDDLTVRSSLFYHGLMDVPVSAEASAFSSLNLLEETILPFRLYGYGSGENYGVDLSFEKMFYSSHYFLFGGSYYESKYKGSDGIERNTRWNGNYTLNGTYAKEWTKKSKNRTIALSSRLLYLGGLRESSVDVASSVLAGQTIYDYSDPFNQKLGDYFRVDLRLSLRKDKPKYTRTFAVDIQNVSNQQNEAYHYYDFTQQKIVTKFQLGIIPVLVYRIDF
jgi:hypothetical protein